MPAHSPMLWLVQYRSLFEGDKAAWLHFEDKLIWVDKKHYAAD